MKVAYQNYNPRGDTEALIIFMDALIDNYQAQGYKLSVRQLYYQLVARDKVPNTEASYKRVASIINDARMGGMIDWDAIEDRNREIDTRSRWVDGAEMLLASARQFHMDMWDNQPTRTFVVVEKAALEGILENVCWKYDVPLLAARGYPSVSILREFALEHIEPAIQAGQTVHLIHMGDHDPSGIDMTRDLQQRIELFLGDDSGLFQLERVALNMDQIRAKRPPPNPAKATDARFKEYKKIHGSQSWELDALEPSYLVELLENHLQIVIEEDLWHEREDEIKDVKQRMTKAAESFR